MQACSRQSQMWGGCGRGMGGSPTVRSLKIEPYFLQSGAFSYHCQDILRSYTKETFENL